jgi:hypothetical protein
MGLTPSQILFPFITRGHESLVCSRCWDGATVQGREGPSPHLLALTGASIEERKKTVPWSRVNICHACAEAGDQHGWSLSIWQERAGKGAGPRVLSWSTWGQCYTGSVQAQRVPHPLTSLLQGGEKAKQGLGAEGTEQDGWLHDVCLQGLHAAPPPS